MDKKLKQIDIKTINNFSIDEENKLYWLGQPIVTSFKLSLYQKIIALFFGIMTLASAIGSAAQGWAAYNQWACENRPMWLCLCKINIERIPSEGR